MYTPAILYAAECDFAARYQLSPTALAALRDCRTQLPMPPNSSVFHQLAVWVVAPVLAGYALWLKAQAAQYEQPIILGVMREGRLLTQLLAQITPHPPQEIWLNRRLSMLAAFGTGDDEALLNWLVRTRLQPIRRSAAIMALTGQPVTTTIDDPLLDISGAQQLLAAWREQGVLPTLRGRAHAMGQRLLQHWQQPVPAATTQPVLLLDFACAGNIQRALHTVLQSHQLPSNLVGLNFVTTQGTKWAKQTGCVLHGYLANDGDPPWFANAYSRTPELIELFAAPPLGSLEDFTENGTPVLGTHFLSAAQSAQITVTQQAILQAAAFYQQHMSAQLTADLGRCLWGRLLLEPNFVEAEALGDWPLDVGLDDETQRCLAPRLATPAPWNKLQTAWPAGTVCRNNTPPRQVPS